MENKVEICQVRPPLIQSSIVEALKIIVITEESIEPILKMFRRSIDNDLSKI
jgi:hypothetical protein